MADFVAADISTTATAPIGTSIYGTIETVGDHDWYKVELEAGKTYEFRLHGMGIDQIDDPFLQLRDAGGNEITSADQYSSWAGENTNDPRLVFTAQTSGTYYLDASTYLDGSSQPRDPSDATTGNFLLTAVEANPNGMVFTDDEIAWQLLDNGVAYFGDKPAAFTVRSDKSLSVNITALTTDGQALAVAALQAWTDVTGINFVQTTGSAEISFDDNDTGAYTDPVVSGNTVTSATINIGTDWLAEFGTTFNSYSFETYIHEIGHALGFGHGGNYNGSADYGFDNYYLNDSLAYSIMSYMQAQDDEFDGSGVNTFVDASFRYMLTPAIADIIAIHNLYGDQVQTETRTGNTTYGFNANTGNAALDAGVDYGSSMFMCVYDDGGKDTLDFSQATVDQLIDLNAETWSNVLGGKMNLSIARGTVIENAHGGSASDILIGNDVANRLSGGGGSDTVQGGAGNDYIQGNSGADRLEGGADNDTLDGGGGTDVLIGGAGNDTYYVDSAADKVTEAAGGGKDTVYASANYTLRAKQEIEALRADAGSTGLVLIGNEIGNTITGGGGADMLDGGNGLDTLKGGGGHDIFLFDTKLKSTNVDTVSDFSHADDTFDIDNAVFAGLKLGKLAKDSFQAIASATSMKHVDGDDFILYDKADGDLYFDRDGAGGKYDRVLFAHVADHTSLNNTDFQIV